MSHDAPDDPADIERRRFTNLILALLGGVTVTVAGCDKASSPAAPSPGTGDRPASVAVNHGHAAVITSAQLAAGGDVTLNIRGTADHPHTVTISVAELSSISGGQRISKESSTDASASAGTHSHSVTFN